MSEMTLEQVRDEMRTWRSHAGFQSGRLLRWADAIDAALQSRAQGEDGANALAILGYIRDAKRFDKNEFENDTAFADWAKSAWHATQVQRTSQAPPAPPAAAVTDIDVSSIASALAIEDGYDPGDLHGGLYEVRWSGGPNPEPEGDAWNMDYMPKAERIAKAINCNRTTQEAALSTPAEPSIPASKVRVLVFDCFAAWTDEDAPKQTYAQIADRILAEYAGAGK